MCFTSVTFVVHLIVYGTSTHLELFNHLTEKGESASNNYISELCITTRQVYWSVSVIVKASGKNPDVCICIQPIRDVWYVVMY